MSVVCYSNGIVEEFRPLEFTFTEDELLKAFSNYRMLKSIRIQEIPNTWLLWGIMDNPPELEYNKLGDEILNEEVFSHIVFIHDSEIDPSWKATDDVLYKSYEEFTQDVKQYLEFISEELVKKNQEQMSEADAASMIFLITMGHTKDKRVLFAFKPDEQSDMFYMDGSFDKFAYRMLEFLKLNFDPDPNKPFVVFADTKTVVIVEDRYVQDLLDKMLNIFKLKERYELCSKVAEIKESWRITHTANVMDPSSAYIELPIDASIADIIKKNNRKRKPKNPENNAGNS
jgi:hypothetical protein